jgi:ATP-dependent Clp protease ATP-binding subunit ClpA
MYGARPIRTWVQNNVMTVISEMLVKKEACKFSTIRIDVMEDKELKYEVVKRRCQPLATPTKKSLI